MRPTFSIIFFTVLSGAGYGVLFIAGLALAMGWPLASPSALAFDGFEVHSSALEGLATNARYAFALTLLVGTSLTTLGLLCSVGHLGKPWRAWRAFSQWRSSWLSREGVVSVLTYVPLVAAFAILVFDAGPSIATEACGLALAFLSAATVFCTGHIYSSLKPIRAWHDRKVVPGYLLLALYTGALWIVVLYLTPTWGSGVPLPVGLVYIANAIVIAPSCAILKWFYWRSLETNVGPYDAGAATGLGCFGVVRTFEQPHTEENYLTHEMGFVLARTHARKLRTIAFWLILLAPLSMIPLGFLLGYPAAWVALVLGMLGIFVERWLFFAQARHTVIAYYGR